MQNSTRANGKRESCPTASVMVVMRYERRGNVCPEDMINYPLGQGQELGKVLLDAFEGVSLFDDAD